MGSGGIPGNTFGRVKCDGAPWFPSGVFPTAAPPIPALATAPPGEGRAWPPMLASGVVGIGGSDGSEGSG